jgi:hypothetical protein
MDAAERLAHDLVSGAFLAGEDQGRWRLVARDGVVVYIAVSAPRRGDAPSEYVLSIDCCGYPDAPPIGVFWDVEKGAELADELWPRLSQTPPDQSFRTDWRPAGATTRRSLYIVTDGLTVASKAAVWLPAHQLEIWRPEVGIACYLEVVHDRLDSPRYLGDGRTARPPAA